MDPTHIVGPMFAMMILTMIVWIYMYARRISFIQASGIDPNQLTPAELERASPPQVANPSDNLKNLFEIPVLFYAVCLYLFAAEAVDAIYVTAAWVFVLFRILHSAVHCTINIVLIRFWLYCIATLALWFVVLRAAASLLTG